MNHAKSRRPNILLILTDDQGWGDLGRTGNPQVLTPELDRLGSEGAVFQWFYVQPLCAPTRAELLTGRQYPKTGVKGVTLGAERLALSERTLADHLKAAGYATGCFGKWHSGMQHPYHPLGRGFDEFYGYCCGHWSHYFDATVEHNGREVKAPGYLTDALTDAAIDFMGRHASDPFFCYVPLNTPHSPFQVPDRWWKRLEGQALTHRATRPERENEAVTRSALAMVENIDWNVGRLRETLARLSLTRDTIVLFLSDNGPNGWRWNGGMDGIKGSSQEGGVRSPLSITWPGRIPAGLTVGRVGGSIDLVPTLLDLVGVERGEGPEPDGISLAGELLAERSTRADGERLLFAQACQGKGEAFGPATVRSQRFRAHENGKLFEIESDPGETRDVSAEHPADAARLKEALAAWRAALPRDPVDPVLPLGWGGHTHSDFPAQDAHLEGTLRFSSIHPNCSWITGWSSLGDLAAWEIEVHTAGRWRVFMQYAATEARRGTCFRLEAWNGGDAPRATMDLTIPEAFDVPPLTGFDRVPREESYEKPFRLWEAGSLELPVGRQTLRLRCTKKPADFAAEVRGLRFVRG